MSEVTVVIPNWNGRELLASICLPSLAAQTFLDSSVIVVDNGSHDGSVEFLRNEWPTVRVIELDRNIGFAGAVNCGIRAADSSLIALVNNDVELEPSWLEELVKASRLYPAAASFASKMMDFEDRDRVAAAGDCLTLGGRIFSRGAGERDLGQFADPVAVFSACAGAALYRREAFDLVGLFDEDFFAYLEDLDWGFRAQLFGFECQYVPWAVAYHVGGGTSSREVGWRSLLIARNTYWLVVKNYPKRVLIRAPGRIGFRVSRRFYRLMRFGNHQRGIALTIEALRGTRRMLRKRSVIQRQRRIDDHELIHRLTVDSSIRKTVRARLLARRFEPNSPRRSTVLPARTRRNITAYVDWEESTREGGTPVR